MGDNWGRAKYVVDHIE